MVAGKHQSTMLSSSAECHVALPVLAVAPQNCMDSLMLPDSLVHKDVFPVHQTLACCNVDHICVYECHDCSIRLQHVCLASCLLNN